MSAAPDAPDGFGDPRLVSAELKPTIDKQRTLTFGREAALWASLGLLPSVRETGLVGAAAALGVAVLGFLASRTAGRYGVGLTPLVRAALGHRVAPLFLLLRWWVGCGIFGAVLASLASRGAGLSRAALPHLELPDMPLSALNVVVTAVLVVAVGVAAARGLRGVRRVMRVAGLVALAAAIGLVVLVEVVAGFAGTTASLTGPPATRAPWLELGVLVLAAPEWARFRNAGAGVARRSPTPLAAGVMGSLLALLAWLLAEAAGVPQSSGLTVDAAAVGGVAAGSLAYAVEAFVFVIAATLLGVYAGSLSLCGVAPWLRYRRAEPLTVVAIVVASLVPQPAWLLALVVPMLGVLLADELVVRRGRVVLEQLYLAEGGVRVAGALGWAVGCGVAVFYSALVGVLAAAAVYAPLALITGAKRARPLAPTPMMEQSPLAPPAKPAEKKKRSKRKDRPGAWAEGPALSDESWNEPEDDDPTATS